MSYYYTLDSPGRQKSIKNSRDKYINVLTCSNPTYECKREKVSGQKLCNIYFNENTKTICRNSDLTSACKENHETIKKRDEKQKLCERNIDRVEDIKERLRKKYYLNIDDRFEDIQGSEYDFLINNISELYHKRKYKPEDDGRGMGLPRSKKHHRKSKRHHRSKKHHRKSKRHHRRSKRRRISKIRR